MDHDQFAEALPKLIEAQRLDPGIGTQFNIAVCYEKLGKLGSAWRNYTDVLRLARASGKKRREDAAREKLAGLESRAPAYVIVAKNASDVSVKIDGVLLSKEDWSRYPVDPGEHTISATAPAKKPWSATMAAPPEGQRADVVIPELQTATNTKVVTVTTETTNTKRTIGFIAGGIGLAGLTVAGITGVMLLDAHSTAESDCTLDIPDAPDRKRCNTQDGRDAVQRGETLLPINASPF
jgi:hypothetical protein